MRVTQPLQRNLQQIPDQIATVDGARRHTWARLVERIARLETRFDIVTSLIATTGEQYGYYVLDEDLRPVEQELPEALQKSVRLIGENCEPAPALVQSQKSLAACESHPP